MTPRVVPLLRLGLARGSRWRVLAIFAGLAVLPSVLAAAPIWAFLSHHLDHAVGLDTPGPLSTAVLRELLRGLDEDGNGARVALGLGGGLVAALLVGPWSAGAAMAQARAEAPLRFRALLGAAGELYGRLLRMLLVAALPLGIAAGIGAGLNRLARLFADQALTEAAASAARRGAMAGVLLAVFLAHLTLDVARAQLVARPARRSALLAWAAGAWLMLRRPVRTVALGLAGTAMALASGGSLMAVRGLLPAGPGWSTALGALLVTAATAGIAWGRSVRLAALAELAAYDQVERERNRALRAERRARRKAERTAKRASRVGKAAPEVPALPQQSELPAGAGQLVAAVGVEGAPDALAAAVELTAPDSQPAGEESPPDLRPAQGERQG